MKLAVFCAPIALALANDITNGMEAGEILADGIATGDLQGSFAQQTGGNSQLSGVISSANGSSFLRAPTVNLHIGEGHAARASFLKSAGSDLQREIENASAVEAAVAPLSARISQGGRMARRALVRALNLAAEPNARLLMAKSSLMSSAARLMRMESTSDSLRSLAGSLITVLSGLPVSSTVVDAEDASYGHVNIVVPRASRVYEPSRYSFLQRGDLFTPQELVMDVNKGQMTVNVIQD